jgi:hypothetical protein
MVAGLIFFISEWLSAEERAPGGKRQRNDADTAVTVSDENGAGRRFVHQIGVEVRPGFVLRTNPFLQGDNENGRPVKNAFSAHLRYSFRAQPDSPADRIFGGAWQGVGLARYTFGESRQIGDPVALYLFQGARLAWLCDRLSLNYEWNFGLSAGWKPYDPDDNYYNVIIGSPINAYINANLYLNWMISRRVDLITGIALTHFSNGNTRFPNAGLNEAGLKAGLVYNFSRKARFRTASSLLPPVDGFPRHISYDLTLFGAWRRKGIALGEERIALPDAYTALGFNFSPMYNLSYRFRTGISLDGFYDGSANIRLNDYIAGTKPILFKPPLSEQLALGLSGRTEYVMPYFSVNLGMGVNIFHGGGDIKTFYQIMALKIAVTRNSFIHIGYSLHNFNTPNALMLGLGVRFNNKYPGFPR